MKNLLLTALLLALPRWAIAAADPITIETKWTTKTMSLSTTGVTSITLDPGGFGSLGYAVIGQTQTANGVDGTTYGALVLITSATPNVVGFSFSAYPTGGSASLKWAQTLKTPAPRGVTLSSGTIMGYNSPYPASNFFSAPLISTSAATAIPSGVPYGGKFIAEVTNPVFYFTGLTASATLYFSVDYGVPRSQ